MRVLGWFAARVFYIVGRISLYARLPKAASAVFRFALRGDRVHEGSARELARTLWQLGFSEAAIQEYRSLVRMHPEKASYFCELGYALRNIDQTAEAIPVLKDALAVELRAEIYVELAHCYRAVGRADEAAAALQRAIRISSSNPEVLLQYIRHLDENRRWPDAIDPGLLLLAQAPSAEIAYITGVGLAQAGRTAEAEQVLSRGLAVEPDDSDLLAALAVVWADMGKASHAKQRLESAVRKNPTDFHLRTALSYVLVSCEEPTAALEAAMSAVPA